MFIKCMYRNNNKWIREIAKPRELQKTVQKRLHKYRKKTFCKTYCKNVLQYHKSVISREKTFKNVISLEPPFNDLFDAQRYPLNLNLSNNEDTSLFLILKRDKFCKFPSLLMLQKSQNCIDTEKPQFSDRKFENVCSDFGV